MMKAMIYVSYAVVMMLTEKITGHSDIWDMYSGQEWHKCVRVARVSAKPTKALKANPYIKNFVWWVIWAVRFVKLRQWIRSLYPA
mmetsp:Transcript_18053/g.41609  ORF Transcript_18053/g.41609 Transcript_18053/m.41609 type:complete len:85 (+) Transcript_18053:5818-6072(+)